MIVVIRSKRVDNWKSGCCRNIFAGSKRSTLARVSWITRGAACSAATWALSARTISVQLIIGDVVSVSRRWLS